MPGLLAWMPSFDGLRMALEFISTTGSGLIRDVVIVDPWLPRRRTPRNDRFDGLVPVQVSRLEQFKE